MNDAEKVREAEKQVRLGLGFILLTPDTLEEHQIAAEALDSILAELAEAKERADHWQHQFHVMGQTARAAEERAEKAEKRGQSYDAGWDEGWAAAEKRAEARIQTLEAENERLRQGLVEALEGQA